jgi:hypothetical protein
MHILLNMYKKYINYLYLHRLNICYSGETGRKVSCLRRRGGVSPIGRNIVLNSFITLLNKYFKRRYGRHCFALRQGLDRRACHGHRALESGAQLLMHRPQGFPTMSLRVPMEIEAYGGVAKEERQYNAVVATERDV